MTVETNGLNMVGRWRPANPEDLLNYITSYYQSKGHIPTVAAIALALNYSPMAVQRIVESRDFRLKAVHSRKLPLIKKSLLSPDEFRAVAIMTDPRIKGGLNTRLKAAGLSMQQYNNLMLQPEFKEAITTNAEMILTNSLAEVNTGLVNAAAKGDVPAIKFYYEVTGRYNPNDQKVMDVMAVLSGVVEILQKHITDPATLERLAGDLSLLAAKVGL